MKPASNLTLGPDTIELLIPHRRPFLMVDVIDGYERGSCPSLRAARHISANEPVFEGHFPGLHLWPGVLTIEGLGQSAYLLHLLWRLEQHWNEQGGNPNDVLQALRNLERGFRMAPGFEPELSARLLKGAAWRGEHAHGAFGGGGREAARARLCRRAARLSCRPDARHGGAHSCRGQGLCCRQGWLRPNASAARSIKAFCRLLARRLMVSPRPVPSVTAIPGIASPKCLHNYYTSLVITL